MNKNYRYKKTVLLTITVFLTANIIFTFVNYKVYREYEINFNFKLDSIVSYLNENYDISKNELIEIIRQEENETNTEFSPVTKISESPDCRPLNPSKNAHP